MTDRPLSPHLQIYRPQLTSVLSIAHRASGVFLGFGAIFLSYWLSAAASGGTSYANTNEYLGSTLGQGLLMLWTIAFYYHLCNGIRHLFWDAGLGFELKTVYASGYAALAGTVVLSGLTWACVLAQGGGP